jgi:two-component system sensor histidine kinase YesM
MVVVLCVSTVISFLYYHGQRRQFEENLINTDKNDIIYLMGNVDKQLRLCEKLSDWIYVNRRIETALIREYAEDTSQYDREIPAIQRLINDHLNSSSIGKHVVFLYIRGDNNVIFKSSNPDADWLRDLTVYNWHREGLAANGKVVWPGIVSSPAVYRTSAHIIPLTRPVIFADTRVPIGWHVLAFSPSLAGDVFEDYQINENRSIVLIDRNNRVVFHQDRKMIGKNFNYDFLDRTGGSVDGNFRVTLNGKPHIITFRKSSYSNMTLMLIHSTSSLEQQINLTLIVLVLVFLLTVIMFFILTYYLSNRLTKPLAAILNRLKEVSSGVFITDEKITGNDEMGQIGRGINEMIEQTGMLMAELIQREHEKLQLEYRVLLNQINPHFIYNVLNSIKMMADIQKIEGISAMASSLGALLKEISKGIADQVPIRRELELLDKYLYIQRIRRNGLLAVFYDIRDEAVLNKLIPRFTLQILAENAIYHGLDQSSRIGELSITIGLEGEDVVIVFRDNGMGVPADKIAALLSGKHDAGEDITHVGIHNVDQRIKLFFGKGGLSIESVEGEYTQVIVRFPQKE